MKQIKWIISGQVQGVGFRFFTQQKAKQLGIYGYVTNRSDGKVEIIAQGSDSQLRDFQKWLELGGPNSADIKQITQYELSFEKPLTSFIVRY